jgi:hypothetical protein
MVKKENVRNWRKKSTDIGQADEDIRLEGPDIPGNLNIIKPESAKKRCFSVGLPDYGKRKTTFFQDVIKTLIHRNDYQILMFRVVFKTQQQIFGDSISSTRV